jgi:flagellar basal body rod protein FlgG
MNAQLYTAASGMVTGEREVELITNNLANLSTPGFRARRSFTAAIDAAVRSANRAVALAGAYEVPGPAAARPTGGRLDVALEQDQLLAVETAGGRRYTRAGNLEVSPAGELVDAAGRRVVGDDGRAIDGLDANAEIDPAGRVVEAGAELARLLIVRDPEGVLEPEGSGLLSAEGRDGALDVIEDPSVRPGWLDGSAADPMQELVRLVEAQRAFESYQKIVRMTMNEVNRRAVNEIAAQ